MRLFGLVGAAVAGALLALLPYVQGPKEASRVTTSDQRAVVEAIQDEIYDEGCQTYGYDASRRSSDTEYELPVYVQPTFKNGGVSWAIYKLLPIGEVLRMFSVRPDGLVVLYGHPEWRFPPTEPSYLTEYMDDDDLCRLKHTWLRTSLKLELRPSKSILDEATARQKLRLGAKYRRHPADCSFSWRKE